MSETMIRTRTPGFFPGFGGRTHNSARLARMGGGVQSVLAPGTMASIRHASAANEVRKATYALIRRPKVRLCNSQGILAVLVAASIQVSRAQTLRSLVCAQTHAIVPGSFTSIPSSDLQNCNFESIQLPNGRRVLPT